MPSFPYNPNSPAPTEKLSVSQPLILENFQSIQSLIDVDHEDFGSANGGNHHKVTMPSITPNPAAEAAKITMFCKPSADMITNPAALALVGAVGIRNGAAVTLPATEFTASEVTVGGSGWTRLPSGIILKWGDGSGAGAAAQATMVGPDLTRFLSISLAIQENPALPQNTFDTVSFTGVDLTPGAQKIHVTVRRSVNGSTAYAPNSIFFYVAIGI